MFLAAEVTFLTEAFPTVLTYVGFLPSVKLHVVPQRAGVRQQLWTEAALNLWEESQNIIFYILNLRINLQRWEDDKKKKEIKKNHPSLWKWKDVGEKV